MDAVQLPPDSLCCELRHPCGCRDSQLPAAGRDACSRHVRVGFAFPGRPNPIGLVPLEVWLLVHWAPPGKNVGEPKLEFVLVPAASRLSPRPKPMCTLVRALSRRVPNQEGAGIGFAVVMRISNGLSLDKATRNPTGNGNITQSCLKKGYSELTDAEFN